MSFMFATCERQRALQFIQKMYPSRVITDTHDSISKLLDFVEADIIRVQDPDFHQPCQIVAGTHWHDSKSAEVMAACEVLK